MFFKLFYPSFIIVMSLCFVINAGSGPLKTVEFSFPKINLGKIQPVSSAQVAVIDWFKDKNGTPTLKRMSSVLDDFRSITKIDQFAVTSRLARMYAPFYFLLEGAGGIKSPATLYFTSLTFYFAGLLIDRNNAMVVLNQLLFFQYIYLYFFYGSNLPIGKLLPFSYKLDLAIEKAKFALDKARTSLKNSESFLKKACSLKPEYRECTAVDKEELLHLFPISTLSKFYHAVKCMNQCIGVSYITSFIRIAVLIHFFYFHSANPFTVQSCLFGLGSFFTLPEVISWHYKILDESTLGDFSIADARISLSNAQESFRKAQDALYIARDYGYQLSIPTIRDLYKQQS